MERKKIVFRSLPALEHPLPPFLSSSPVQPSTSLSHSFLSASYCFPVALSNFFPCVRPIIIELFMQQYFLHTSQTFPWLPSEKRQMCC